VLERALLRLDQSSFVVAHDDEGSWWGKTGIDPLAAARAFWLETHPLGQWEPTVANMKAPER
jgi:hypothetical protein